MKKPILIVFCFLSITLIAANNKVDKTKEAKAREWIKNQSLEFIENKGQFCNTDGKPADNVLFRTNFGNCDIYITNKGLSYVFVKYDKEDEANEKTKRKPGENEDENKKAGYYRLDMNLKNANISKINIIKEDISKQGHYNYYYANCPEGIYNVKAYSKITIKNIYKGIDWVIYTNSDSKEHPLKYDFIVHPGADYKDIQIKFLNAQSTTLSENDAKLKIQTIAGNIEEGNLYSYVKSENIKMKNEKLEISSKYLISNDSTISFEIANYDTTKILVIDPLVWATYYGTGTSYDGFKSICTDSLNNIFIAGYTTSTNFPTKYLPGAFWQDSLVASNDLVILKFNSMGIRLWSTFYGGDAIDIANSICTDMQNNIIITGYTASSNFPLQQLAGAYNQPIYGGNSDVFILKFNNQGIRLWATNYGGSLTDNGSSICSDSQGNIYIAGMTSSQNLPTQQLAASYWQPLSGGDLDAFILKFNSQGSRLWATYYGGSDFDHSCYIGVDSHDNLFVTGYTYSSNFPIQQLMGAYWQATNAGNSNSFILKFNNQCVRQWSTYYGGSSAELASSLCFDSNDNLYITGNAYSTDMPTQILAGAYNQQTNAGLSDIFLLKFNNQGARLWATYYGGNDSEGSSECVFLGVDLQDNIYLTGYTQSSNFPLQQLNGEYWQSTFAGICDIFIIKFNNTGIRKWATYYGTYDADWGAYITTDLNNDVYFIGEWNGIANYTVDYGNGSYYDDSWNGEHDSFILKISQCNNQKPTSLHSDRNDFCENDNGNITFTAIGGIGDTLKWYSGSCGQNYIGQNTPLIIPSPTQTTTYYARWESICDTSDCDSIKIVVKPIKTSSVNPVICQGDTYQVGTHIFHTTGIYIDTLATFEGCDSIITSNLTVNPTKQITVNPTICQGNTYQVGNHIYHTTGIYIDTLTTYSGCDSIVRCNLSVIPYPVADLGNDTTLCQGIPFVLNATTANATYLWQDGSSSSIYHVYHQGLYWVKVAVNNCIGTDSININIENCNTIYIPNAFVPVGINKIFKPVGNITSYTDYYFAIFNRWGQQIFETCDFEIGWDGSYQGKTVQSGVFVYYLKITFEGQGKTIEKTGRVTLVE